LRRAAWRQPALQLPRLKAFLAEMAQEWQRLAEDAKSGEERYPTANKKEDPGD
jgi:hypothetical protein